MIRIVELEELRSLPKWARVSFAARTLRRIQPICCSEQVWREEKPTPWWPKAPEAYIKYFDYALQMIEKRCEEAKLYRDDDILKGIVSVAAMASNTERMESESIASTFATMLVYLAQGHENTGYMDPEHIAFDAANLYTVGEEYDRHVRHDFELLATLSDERQWNDDSPIPKDVYGLHSLFKINDSVDKQTLIEITTEINARTVEFFRSFPDRLLSLTSRQFEELVAELWSGFGFEVELTKRTRDGGKDVIAVAHYPARIRLLIECKRYSENNLVGVALVRELHGVVAAEGANKGIIATTSRFSSDAQEHLAKSNWILEGRDFDGVVEWLNDYQKFKFQKNLGIWLPTSSVS